MLGTTEFPTSQVSPLTVRKIRSSKSSINLSLPQLPLRIPTPEGSSSTDGAPHISYLEGYSPPTTPALLARSASYTSTRRLAQPELPKSKSSTHLLAVRQLRSGTSTPGRRKLRRSTRRLETSPTPPFFSDDQNDPAWILRTGASMASSARESKGQAWLVSRASSTSMTRLRDDEYEEYENEYAWSQRHQSQRASLRGSVMGEMDREVSLAAMKHLNLRLTSGHASRSASRFGSRCPSRNQLPHTPPMTAEFDAYFDYKDFTRDDFSGAEPDFVNVDETFDDETDREDEAEIKRLTRANTQGVGGWVKKMLGWRSFPTEEESEEIDDELFMDNMDDVENMEHMEYTEKIYEVAKCTLDLEVPAPPKDSEASVWQDTVWFLRMATNVLL
ncbi:BgTH12-00711 [Blumeria graminis f. sp. triticale]|uniref:BgTH12-00711 n=1 Tax=Blumeria graminis f. sp. triticale TaxID=1689686 RepID=A0A9W4D6I9_BLUGR|nr:BgTH12-00711 [Blumeria graminis f. sp. triticale]